MSYLGVTFLECEYPKTINKDDNNNIIKNNGDKNDAITSYLYYVTDRLENSNIYIGQYKIDHLKTAMPGKKYFTRPVSIALFIK